MFDYLALIIFLMTNSFAFFEKTFLIILLKYSKMCKRFFNNKTFSLTYVHAKLLFTYKKSKLNE